MVHGGSFQAIRFTRVAHAVYLSTEPMTDLFAVFSKLVTPSGEILVPGIADKVAPLTPEEKARYEVIDITVRLHGFSSAALERRLILAPP